MSTFGRTLLAGQAGYDIMASADGHPQLKAGGVTIDWSTVTAVSGTDVTLNDGTVVKIGNKYLRYGQVLTKITNQPVMTATISGSPTGGTFQLSGVRPDTGNTVTTAPLAYNASGATVLAALQAVFGTLNVASVALSTGVYTITFNAPVALLTAINNLTGGSSPAVAMASSTAGLNYGYFGPYDPSASDGRQTLTRGECFILNRTALQNLALGFGLSADDNAAVLDGGLVWKDRILQAGGGSHTLAAGPTLAEFLAAFPSIRFAEN